MARYWDKLLQDIIPVLRTVFWWSRLLEKASCFILMAHPFADLDFLSFKLYNIEKECACKGVLSFDWSSLPACPLSRPPSAMVTAVDLSFRSNEAAADPTLSLPAFYYSILLRVGIDPFCSGREVDAGLIRWARKTYFLFLSFSGSWCSAHPVTTEQEPVDGILQGTAHTHTPSDNIDA